MKNLTLQFCAVVLSLLVAVGPARAQDAVPKADFDFESGESSLLVGTPHPALFSDFKIEGYDYLEASLTVEDKGAKVTWAPFLTKKHSFWSETRLQLSQKDDITSLGVSLQYNPLNPRSANGKVKWDEYWEKVNKESPHGTFHQHLGDAKRTRKSILEEQEFKELTQLADDACKREIPETAKLRQKVLIEKETPASGLLLYRIHCALTELQGPVAKLRDEIAVLELESKPDEELIKEKKDELKPLAQAFSTLLSASERAYVEQRANEPGMTRLTSIRAGIAELDESIEATITSYAANAYTGYREKLYESRKPVVNLSYINSFFSVIDGGEVDNDGDGLNDNDHRLKSRSLALSLDWKIGERSALAFQLSRSTERASAEEGAAAADYDGFAATWSHRLVVLNKDGYSKTKDYKESLFVPSIVFGLAYESRDCDSPDADCAKGILSTRAVTPFVDFKIKKSAQFRIGFPFKRDRIFRAATGETEEDSIDIVSLVAFQLGAPN